MFTPSSIIPRRSSCRSFKDEPLSPGEWQAVLDLFGSLPAAPFGTVPRLALVSPRPGMRGEKLKLGTYGFVSHPAAFIVPAVTDGPMVLEDLGYLVEHLVLSVTLMGLGSCWLGATFSRGGFVTAADLSEDEIIPAVVALGHPADKRTIRDRVTRMGAGSDRRLAFEDIFFDREWGISLTVESAGPWAKPLEMLRLGPSASNNQPWRIVRRDKDNFHLYLLRTPGYRERNGRLFGVADMQRIDMGIAMCHFHMTAMEQGLPGRWCLACDRQVIQPEDAEYVATWHVSP